MLKLRKKRMIKKGFIFFVFLFSNDIFSEINIDPGEIFALKVTDCPSIKSKKELFIIFKGTEYAILSAPFSKNELIINKYCFPVKVEKKEFGESRITIEKFIDG
jgi:hypothetical protein